jgi:hypothetical protein
VVANDPHFVPPFHDLPIGARSSKARTNIALQSFVGFASGVAGDSAPGFPEKTESFQKKTENPARF